MPHVDALRALGDAAGSEPPEDVRRRLDVSLQFLQHHLLPHATAEGVVLYPAVASLLGGPNATATMERDHLEVQRLTEDVAALAGTLAQRTPAAADLLEVQRLAYGLYALLKVHFAKEEEIYLPLLDAHLDAEAATALFVRMEAAAAAARAPH